MSQPDYSTFFILFGIAFFFGIFLKKIWKAMLISFFLSLGWIFSELGGFSIFKTGTIHKNELTMVIGYGVMLVLIYAAGLSVAALIGNVIGSYIKKNGND
jgi:hypothetical protein